MENSKRTVTCGDLRKSDVGKTVVLNGWVHRNRLLGGLSFILLRDRYGFTQVVVGDKASDDVKKIASSLKSEYCVAIKGVVIARADKDVNKDMPTGEIEVEAEEIEIFTTSDVLPFQIDEVRQKDGTIVLPAEEIRLKYRYLDLRREPMQKNIILRSEVTFATREYLTGLGFLEIELRHSSSQHRKAQETTLFQAASTQENSTPFLSRRSSTSSFSWSPASTSISRLHAATATRTHAATASQSSLRSTWSFLSRTGKKSFRQLKDSCSTSSRRH